MKRISQEGVRVQGQHVTTEFIRRLYEQYLSAPDQHGQGPQVDFPMPDEEDFAFFLEGSRNAAISELRLNLFYRDDSREYDSSLNSNAFDTPQFQACFDVFKELVKRRTPFSAPNSNGHQKGAFNTVCGRVNRDRTKVKRLVRHDWNGFISLLSLSFIMTDLLVAFRGAAPSRRLVRAEPRLLVAMQQQVAGELSTSDMKANVDLAPKLEHDLFYSTYHPGNRPAGMLFSRLFLHSDRCISPEGQPVLAFESIPGLGPDSTENFDMREQRLEEHVQRVYEFMVQVDIQAVPPQFLACVHILRELISNAREHSRPRDPAYNISWARLADALTDRFKKEKIYEVRQYLQAFIKNLDRKFPFAVANKYITIRFTFKRMSWALLVSVFPLLVMGGALLAHLQYLVISQALMIGLGASAGLMLLAMIVMISRPIKKLIRENREKYIRPWDHPNAQLDLGYAQLPIPSEQTGVAMYMPAAAGAGARNDAFARGSKRTPSYDSDTDSDDSTGQYSGHSRRSMKGGSRQQYSAEDSSVSAGLSTASTFSSRGSSK